MRMPRPTEAYKREVGLRMRHTREALGKSQRRLAKELGLESNSWNQYEQGVRLIDPLTLGRWLRLDDLPMEWIYLGDIRRLRYEIASKLETEGPETVESRPHSSASLVKQKAAR